MLSKIPGTNTFTNQSYSVPIRNLSSNNETTKNTDPLTIETDENDFTNQLGRALKRKFTELEEISQRLKARLFDVTADDTDDEFERDLNTIVESDDEEVARDGEDFAWLGDDKSMFLGGFCGTKDPTCQSEKKELDTALKIGDIETSVNLFKSILSNNVDGTTPSTSQQGIGNLSQAFKEASISDEKWTEKGDDKIN